MLPSQLPPAVKKTGNAWLPLLSLLLLTLLLLKLLLLPSSPVVVVVLFVPPVPPPTRQCPPRLSCSEVA
jgi:hypothetical protein